MTIPEPYRTILIASAVFAPCLAVLGVLTAFATRTIAEPRSRRRYRIVLGVWCLLAAGAMAAYVLAHLGVMSGEAVLLHVRRTILGPLVAYLLVLIALGQVDRRIQDAATRLKVRKAVIYVFIVIVAAWLATTWLIQEEINYGTIVGVVGAGLALSLHQVLLCMFGWLMLQIHRYYDVGDRVQIGTIRGDVSDVGLFHTALVEVGEWTQSDEYTGRLVSVPNSSVFTGPILNYTRGFEYIWNEIRVVVTYESDWRKAARLMLGLVKDDRDAIHERFSAQVRRMAKRYHMPFGEVAPAVHPRILDSGVELALRYLTDPRTRRRVESRLTGEILDAFAAEADVELAYPTRTTHIRDDRGAAPRDLGSGPPALHDGET